MNELEHRTNTVLFMGTYPPRECGIATFTQDLAEAIDKQFSPAIKTKVIALNKNGTNIYNYPKKVVLQISDTDISDFIERAKKINKIKNIKLVSIQHEFGLYSGEYGEYILAFLEVLKKPAIITFHSILPNPNKKLKTVVQEIAKRVKHIVVMTDAAIGILRRDYAITTPITIIPHGIPNVAFEAQQREKKNLGLHNRIVLSSFGMMSKNKGYEYVIEALSELIKKFPNIIYLIVGETHPVVRKKEGEKYRNMLEREVKEHNLQKHVKFYNKYLTKKEIIQYLKATDLYICPSLTPEQITSGTLVYAMGCGRAVIATPFLHARDVVTKDRGRLVSFGSAPSIRKAIMELLEQKDRTRELERNAYAYTRPMIWQNVGISYARLFNSSLDVPEIYFTNIPHINVSHLRKLTDDFGIVQFANYAHPDVNSGYTLDDNARALIVCGALYEKFKKKNKLALMKTYLNYMKYVQQADGKLYNYVTKTKILDKDSWSEEAHGRALRALGYIASLKGPPKDIKHEAETLFATSLPVALTFEHPRPIASVIVGLYHYNKEKYSEEHIALIKKLADHLVALYEQNSSTEWRWFDHAMTYSNAKLPESLLYAYIATQDKKYLMIAKESLDFLIAKTFDNNTFIPIGQNGWYNSETNQRALFDQQPIEAAAMTNALVIASRIFRNPRYRKLAMTTFNWFLGKNIVHTTVYNEETGGCHDGLGQEVVNMNQGAESTLAYLMARISLEEHL